MSRINPPNNTMGRALFCWQKSELDSSQERSSIVGFCQSNSITTILLHFYQWIGGGNWNPSNMKSLIDALNDASIEVYGLVGAPDYAVNQLWVRRNIIDAVRAYNSIYQNHRLNGLLFDNEYWTNPQTFDPQDYVPAYCRLLAAARQHLNIPVGVFAQRSLLDDTRDAIDYDGLNDVDGAHLLRASDFVFVGSYDNEAEPHDSYPGQIDMLTPWVDRASEEQTRAAVWGCSETKNVQPSWITYYGSSKAAMEAEHTLITSSLTSALGSAYVGQAVHDYTAYKVMQ